MTARLGLTIVGVLCAVILAAVLWRWTTEPARQAQKAAEARASQTVADGQVAAGRDAVAIVTGNAAHGQEIDRQTQENRDAILSAPGADTQLDPGLDSALRRSLCQRASVRDPSCQPVQQPRPR